MNIDLLKNQYDKVAEQNKSLQKDLKLLNEMLNIAVAAMNENELCSYCKHNNNCDRNSNDVICINGILGGLENIAMANLTQK